MELIFRGTRDGMNGKSFHSKCDHQGQTITICKNEKGYIFGGYASIPWASNSPGDHSAPESFLFTLTNIHCTEPTKFPSKNDKCEVYNNGEYGPIFGNGRDLGIYQDFVKKGGWSNFPDTYIDILNKGKSIFTGDFNNNNEKFNLKEIEAFKI